MLKHIPNLITSCNLLCGCLGIVFAFNGELENSVYSIWIAMLFDFMDGFSARILKVSSEIGKQLDSLADMVTFGLLPAVILYQVYELDSTYIKYLAFLLAVFSALRLAKFNTDDSQSDSFVGIPTPANALFVSSLVFVLPKFPVLESTNAFILITLSCSFWLVMPVRLLALKFKSYSLAHNIYRYTLILVSIIAIVIFKQLAIPLIIIVYLLLSIMSNIFKADNIK